MAKQNEHQCPECGTPRGADNTPSCACGERAAEALRDARTAEQAAAEDFDPLRIRPYVALDPAPPADQAPAADATLPLPLLTQPPGGAGLPEGSTLPEAFVAPEARTAPETLEALHASEPPAQDPHPDRPRGRRRTTLLAATAILGVAATAAFAGGLFSYDPPARDGAAPESVREAVPQARTSAPTPSPSVTAPSATPSTASASPSPTPTASPSPSTSAATPTPSPTPTGSSPTPTAPGTPTPTPADRDEPPPTLRRGDSGDEVTELQLRLHQLYLYNGHPHGDYSRQVEDAVRMYQWTRGIRDDEPGVYGEETRQKLESETSEP
ncbi:peptidoglycan-binding protein [Streptomyces sp. NPDC089424]|uniref:peptidoglycan-binding domain-containing protein n=1 Tax=Streptomyces sp. NPDC089424 TaxID=3365917 RepID=UPI0038199C31